MNDFEVIVVGGGHAGVEAALASARLGRKTALISHDQARLGALSCNPAVGGLGKGHLVREIDALGGAMGRLTDAAAIQYRRLNMRKGPAVRATRCQVDRVHYARATQAVIKAQPGLSVIQGEGLEVEPRPGGGWRVGLADGTQLNCRAAVLTTGTFLNGLIHIGGISFSAGRLGDAPSRGLSEALARLGVELARLKTGTPPRLRKDSIDFSGLAVQQGDETPRPFSILTGAPPLPQLPCHVTRTTAQTHEIIRGALNRSALFSGRISGIGARYCPSIEDKIVKFPDRDSHHIFLEPEGLESDLIYPNGISTSLPLDVQEALVHTLPGLDRAVLDAPGYAIEYDFVPPTQVNQDLNLRGLPGLFLAGQINGTSGYEEAGAQGLMAGLNAARLVEGAEPVILSRDKAYIAVMIDDLTTLGTNEPYRMFTSRAEYRLLLREDNAAERLTPLGRELGLVNDRQWAVFNRRRQAQAKARQGLTKLRVRPTADNNRYLKVCGSSPLSEAASPETLLKRPELSWEDIAHLAPELPVLDEEAAEAVEVEVKYAGYVAKQMDQVARFKELEEKLLPEDMDYAGLPGLRRELVEKLTKVRPRSVGQAARIPGVTPAALIILSIQAAKERGRAA